MFGTPQVGGAAERAIQKSMFVMVCVAPAGAPFYSDPYRGFAALTPGYFLSPLRGFKKYAALGVPPPLPVTCHLSPVTFHLSPVP